MLMLMFEYSFNKYRPIKCGFFSHAIGMALHGNVSQVVDPAFLSWNIPTATGRRHLDFFFREICCILTVKDTLNPGAVDGSGDFYVMFSIILWNSSASTRHSHNVLYSHCSQGMTLVIWLFIRRHHQVKWHFVQPFGLCTNSCKVIDISTGLSCC